MDTCSSHDRLAEKIDLAVDRIHNYQLTTNDNINGLRLDVQTAVASMHNRVNELDLKIEKVSWKQKLIVSAMALISGGAGASIVEFLKKNI